MSDEGRFITGEYRLTLTADTVVLMLNLLDVPSPARLLILEPGDQLTHHARAQGYDVTQIPYEQPLDAQVDLILSSGPYDGAILLPFFARVQTTVSPPPGWDIRRSIAEDMLLAHVTSKLFPSGALVALVPNGLLANYSGKGVRQGLVEHGLAVVATISPDMIFTRSPVAVGLSIIVVQCQRIDSPRTIAFLDLRDLAELPSPNGWNQIMAQPPELQGIVPVTHLIVEEIGPDYRLDPQYYDPTYLQIRAPEGYVEVSLGEIAVIRGGVHLSRSERFELPPGEQSIPFVQVRHILPDGTLALDSYWADEKKSLDLKQRRALPGDILLTTVGTVGKVAFVPTTYRDGLLFDTSLRCIRVTDIRVSSETVYEFLRSNLAQLQLRRLTGGSSIPQITTPLLETMRIFLPALNEQDDKNLSSEVYDTLNASTEASIIADALESQLIGFLRSVDPEDTTWQQVFEEKLRALASTLVPKSLDMIILEDFPTFIAIPYRRFQMARYNPYERLDRMVSLVESCIYFVFHVLVVDYARHGWQSNISLSKDAKNALKGRQSIDYRLKFITEVCDAARNGVVTLFMPELLDCPIVDIGNTLREDVRNPISHSAPGSEPYIRTLIERHVMDVERLLQSLHFLKNYRLCRIRNHSYHNQQWFYQAEMYRGAEYDLNIQEVEGPTTVSDASTSSEPIEAERDHLILLSADDEVLDLYPFYQLYFGDETCRESHLCFFKHRQGSKLIGESIRSSIEVSLHGSDEFQKLTGFPMTGESQDS